MAKPKRVFQVAKELGVTSKAIVEKCVAEEVPGITNHMSTVKVGLEATIHEWFSDAPEVESPHTAVETADKVDLTKARKGVRRRKAKSKTADEAVAAETSVAADGGATVTATVTVAAAGEDGAGDVGASSSTATAVAEPPPTPVEQEAEVVSETTAAAEVEAPTEDAADVAVEAQEDTAVTEATPDEPKALKPMGKPNVPQRPAEIKPVGQQLEKPKEAVLKGPKVVRVEEPDKVQPQRHRRPPAEAAPAPGTVEGITRSKGPQRGKGVSDDRGPEPGQGDKKAGGKRRSLTSRRGRSADAQLTGPGNYSEQDLIELDARLRGAPGFVRQRRRDLRKRQSAAPAAATPAEVGGTVEIAEPVTIKNLSAETGIKSSEIIKYLFTKGIMSTINSAIDAEAAMEVAMEYDIELIVKEQRTAEEKVVEEFEQREQVNVTRRPPVVTVLGHVDHGKTSLLDRIRESDVAAHEAGGITQHVGAHRVTIKGSDEHEKTVVFLDTPGHEAFTSMRARGAMMTDLIVLVVAADDGVMPQTTESINHAKAAGVPIIVALNKIDLLAAEGAARDQKMQQIYGQLAEQELNPTAWGGETEVVPTSAETGEGVTGLLELLDLQAEILELTADYGGPARGTVIEAQMQEGRGPVARVLVQQGRIAVGDFIVIGRSFGRVRDMTDDRGQSLAEAWPATPLELSGIDVVPDAGDKFYVTNTLRKAEEVAEQTRQAERQQQLASKTTLTLDNFADQLKAGQTKELRVVIKADVQGSLDVLNKSMSELGNDEVGVRVIHAAVGGINESDVLLAEASDAVIIGFHVVASQHARDLGEQRGVDIRLHRVIYDVTDEITQSLEGMLAPQTSEEVLGQAEVRQIFKISKVGNIAGCLVTEGAIRRNCKIRVVRDGVVVTENRDLATLRRVKDDASEVRMGTECGIRIDGFDDVKPDDILVCYNLVSVARKLG